MSPLRVLHLVGSPVSELYADLSRLYAADCLVNTADPRRYEFAIAYVEPGGTWSFPSDLSAPALSAAERMTLPQAVAHIGRLAPDVAVPQMFCRPGMTSYRALLDLLDVSFVGNSADVMALGADKAKAKAVVASAGVAVPTGEVLRYGEQPTLAPPAVVKPLDADNSLGVTLVRQPADFAPALDVAYLHSDAVLVERYVPLGREVRCGVVVRGDELVCLPLEEYNVDPDDRPVRSQADKLRRNSDGALALVAKDPAKAWIVDPSDAVVPAVWDAARRCHIALGCRDYSLFDFRIDPAGRPWFLEAGLYCSFARQSVVAVMAAAAGIPLADLFGQLIFGAQSRA